MKTLLYLLVLLICAAACSAEVPDQIKLSNGFVLRGCEILHWDNDSVLVRYVGGTVPIKFANMAPESRTAFEAEKKTEMAKQKRQASFSRAPASASSASNADDSGSERAEAERKADEIKHAIFTNSLVRGMTEDQVRQSLGGGPTRTLSGGDIWIYQGRGKHVDSYGVPTDRTLYFSRGILTGWDE